MLKHILSLTHSFNSFPSYDTLGVKKLVIAVNKMDEETVKWSEARYNDIVTRLTPYLKSVGYNVQRDVSFLPVSGLKSYNLKDPIPEGVCPWYTGPTLFSILDSMDVGNRDASAPLRLPVLEKYNDRGCTISGKVESGRLVGFLIRRYHDIGSR